MTIANEYRKAQIAGLTTLAAINTGIEQNTGGGHMIEEHSDTVATGAQLNELVGGDETILHSHVYDIFTSRFSGHLVSNQTIVKNSWTKVLFNTEDYDGNSEFASNRFTVKDNGYYHIDAKIKMFMASSFSMLMGLYKNGIEIERDAHNPTNILNYSHSGLSLDLYLVTNDYLEVWVYHTDTVDRDCGSGLGNYFNCHRFA